MIITITMDKSTQIITNTVVETITTSNKNIITIHHILTEMINQMLVDTHNMEEDLMDKDKTII
jgi:hypothetical protein